MKRIDILYFQGCPNHAPAVDMAKRMAEELALDAAINEIEILGPEDAKEKRFLGSPSIRVDGIDIEVAARNREDFGYSCRTYSGKGIPDRATWVAGLTGAQGESSRGRIQTARWASGGAVFAALVASACCWLPLTLLAFGLSAGGLGAVFETTRPYFLAAAAVLLAAGFYITYRRSETESCASGAACAAPNPKLQRFNRAVLWVSTAGVIAFATFPFYVGGLLSEPIEATTELATAQVDLQIDGMTCEGCATILHDSLLNVPGVFGARIDYKTGRATLTLAAESPDAQSAALSAVTSAGFQSQLVTSESTTHEPEESRDE